MKRTIANSIKAILTLMLACAFWVGNSQTANEAAELYNAGIKVINDDPAGALLKFEECIEICEEVGFDADETKLIAESQVPICYYKIAQCNYYLNEYETAKLYCDKIFQLNLQVKIEERLKDILKSAEKLHKKTVKQMTN